MELWSDYSLSPSHTLLYKNLGVHGAEDYIKQENSTSLYFIRLLTTTHSPTINRISRCKKANNQDQPILKISKKVENVKKKSKSPKFETWTFW